MPIKVYNNGTKINGEELTFNSFEKIDYSNIGNTLYQVENNTSKLFLFNSSITNAQINIQAGVGKRYQAKWVLSVDNQTDYRSQDVYNLNYISDNYKTTTFDGSCVLVKNNYSILGFIITNLDNTDYLEVNIL